MSGFDIYHSYYNKLNQNYLIVDDSDKDFFQKHTNKITLKSGDVSGYFDKEAIIAILTNYSENLLRVANNDLEFISVGYFSNGDYSKICSMKKSDFAKLATKIAQMGKFDGNEKILNVIGKLAELTDPKQAVLPQFDVTIDGKKYSLDSKTIMQFLIDGYKNYNFRIDKTNILGLPKHECFFMLKEFITKNKLKEKYVFDKNSQSFIDRVLTDFYANTFHFNKILYTTDENLGEVKLDEDFVKFILSDMPEKYSKIEKAIYIYIKLCKVLTYDAEFYANSQKGMTALKHKDITRLETITATNNQIVCYEFAQIYAILLNHLGINYEIAGTLEYGLGHRKLFFRANDFIVSADSVTSILGGDLYNAKINKRLEGLLCKNKNKQTVALFNKFCRDVYQNLIKNESSKQTDEDVFEEFLAMFNNFCTKEVLSKQQKTEIFEKQSKQTKLPTTEKITHLMRIAKRIFFQEMRQKKFDITIINSKKIQGFKITSEPLIVFAFNEHTFNQSPNETTYYIVRDDGTLKEISKEEINKNFDSGMFKYINAGARGYHAIPGLQTEGQSVR